MHILIAEDDRALATVWHEVLTRAGHRATFAHDAESARKMILTGTYDSAVLDLCLGQDTGLSVAALAPFCNPECRIIVVTGSMLFARGELFMMAPNIAAVLRKPVCIHDLVAVLEHETCRDGVQGSPACEPRDAASSAQRRFH